MDLVPAIRVLRDRLGWVLVAAVVAIAAGAVVGFNLSLFPPSLKARSASHGTATTKLLVDTRSSALTDSRRDYESLITRAGVYAQLVSSESVRRLVSRYSGIPKDQLATEVPQTGQLITNQPRPNRPGNPAERSSEVSGEDEDYRIDVGVEVDLPTISIATQAPDEKQAVRLANATAKGLRGYVEGIDRRRRANGRTVRIRELGRAVGGTVSGRPGVAVAGAITIVLFVLGCLVILAVAGVARRWAEADSGAAEADSRPSEGDAAPNWPVGGEELVWQCSACGNLSTQPSCPDHPAAPVRLADGSDGQSGGVDQPRRPPASLER